MTIDDLRKTLDSLSAQGYGEWTVTVEADDQVYCVAAPALVVLGDVRTKEACICGEVLR